MATVWSWRRLAGNQASPCESALQIHFLQSGPQGDRRTHEHEGLEGDAPSAEGSRRGQTICHDGRASASLRPKAVPGKAVARRSRPGSATSGSGSRAKSRGDTVCGGSLTGQAAIEQRAGSVHRAGSMLRNAGAEVSRIQVADDHSQGRGGAYPRLRHQPRSANISQKKDSAHVDPAVPCSTSN
jgi:hypothetical protein